ncbi:flavin reductase family protein [Kribbella sp. NPDC051620]|uniref:flavin reductase family protein n=1 Tax=Kribbella sp. NPDC051620 TaxID=3364120 RepID=UPI00378736F4
MNTSDNKVSPVAAGDCENEQLRFRSVLRTFASGVAVVTIADSNGVHGMTASSFTSVSLEPPLCSVSVNRLSLLSDQPSRMHTLLQETDGLFGISILTDQQGDVADFYARRPWAASSDIDIEWRDGCPLIAGSLAWLVCHKWAEYDGGDHSIFVGHPDLYGSASSGDLAPLIHHDSRYHRLGVTLGDTDIQ